MATLIAMLIAGAAVAQDMTAEWQEVSGLVLQSPARLVRKPIDAAGDSHVKDAVTYQANASGLQILVDSLEYVGGTPNLAGAAAGAVRSVSQMAEITSPKYTVSDVTISGLPAKRVSYAATAENQAIYMELISVAKGQHVWTVEIVFQGASKDWRSRAEAIINSVRIK